MLTCSAAEGTGLAELWEQIVRHQDTQAGSGALAARRREQQVRWVWTMVQDRLLTSLRDNPRVAELAPKIEAEVTAGTPTPALAADELLAAFYQR